MVGARRPIGACYGPAGMATEQWRRRGSTRDGSGPSWGTIVPLRGITVRPRNNQGLLFLIANSNH